MVKPHSNKRKSSKLGIPFGTATHRLRKMVMFMLAQKAGMDTCYRCSKQIETVEEFSLEHTDGWEKSSDPITAFFDLSKIAFSHLRCNLSAASRTPKKWASAAERERDPQRRAYRRGWQRRDREKNGRYEDRTPSSAA